MSCSPASGRFSPRFGECGTGTFTRPVQHCNGVFDTVTSRESYLCVFPKWNTKPFTCIVSIHIPGSPEPPAGQRYYAHGGKTDRLHIFPFKFFTTGYKGAGLGWAPSLPRVSPQKGQFLASFNLEHFPYSSIIPVVDSGSARPWRAGRLPCVTEYLTFSQQTARGYQDQTSQDMFPRLTMVFWLIFR